VNFLYGIFEIGFAMSEKKNALNVSKSSSSAS
jgi:hypothetical protein